MGAAAAEFITNEASAGNWLAALDPTLGESSWSGLPPQQLNLRGMSGA